MTKTRRINIILILLIACAAVMLVAVFSMSFAKWIADPPTSVSVSATVGKYYVNFSKDETDLVTIREVNGKTEKDPENPNDFIYHNYISISREDVGSDTSLAFVEFFIEGLNGTDLSAVNVKSITLTRLNTSDSNDGTISGDNLMSPRLNGYEAVSTLADINSVEELAEQDTHQIDHRTGGIFCTLYFSPSNKYYAMDITITTDRAAEFKLTAKASNTSRWQRYEDGYGEPYGFYLGGYINGAHIWDPTYSANMSGTKLNVVSDLAISQTGKKYPKYMDVAININLTAGSMVKLYMLDGVGKRIGAGNQTVYFIPRQIIYPKELKVSESYDVSFISDICTQLTRDGEYTFHFIGAVSFGGYYYNDTHCGYIKKNGDAELVGDNYVKDFSTTTNLSDSSVYGVTSGDCVVETLIITYKDPKIEADKHTVTFVNPERNGGRIDSVKVENSTKLQDILGDKIPNIGTEYNGYKILGYYVDKTFTTPYDFSKTVKTDSIIYIKCRLINMLSDDYYIVGEVSNWAIKDEMLIERDTGTIELDMDIGYSFVITKKADDGSPDYSGIIYGYSYLEDDSGWCKLGENNKIVLNSAAKYRITFVKNNAITKIIVDCIQFIEPEWGVFYVIGSFTEAGGEIWKIRQDMKLDGGSIELHLNAKDEFKLTEWCGVGIRPVWDHCVGYKYLTGSGAVFFTRGDYVNVDPNIKVSVSGTYRITFDSDSADRSIVIERIDNDYEYNFQLSLNGTVVPICVIPISGTTFNVFAWDNTPEQSPYCGAWPGTSVNDLPIVDGLPTLVVNDNSVNIIFWNSSGQTQDLAITLNSDMSDDTISLLNSNDLIIVVKGAASIVVTK